MTISLTKPVIEALMVVIAPNLKQSEAKRPGMAERAAALMELHFPGDWGVWAWKRKSKAHPSGNVGFATVPRTLPIAMEAIDHLSKGQPCGHTLFCLWARAPDHPLVVIENPATFAAEAGFTGNRAVDTWRRRMKVLRDHWFIQAKKGASGDFHYVLLLNPNAAVDLMHRNGLIQADLYGRFGDRLREVGGTSELKAFDAYWAARNAEAAHQQQASANQQAQEDAEVPPTPIEEIAEQNLEPESAAGPDKVGEPA